MSCERTCRDECKMTFEADFKIKEKNVEVDVPDKACYDEELLKSMTDEERKECEEATSDVTDKGVI